MVVHVVLGSYEGLPNLSVFVFLLWSSCVLLLATARLTGYDLKMEQLISMRERATRHVSPGVLRKVR